MKSLRNVYHAQVVHLSALFLTLFFSLTSLVSCNQPAPPAYTAINLGIPAAALQSPVKGPLPDATLLHVGITFKIDPRLLDQANRQKLQPGQNSNLESLAKRLGISQSTYQQLQSFFSLQGITLQLSKLRTHLSVYAKAGTLARLLQTKFVIHQYKGRAFYAPATPPKVPSFLANSIDAITGLDNYSKPPLHALTIHFSHPQGEHTPKLPAQDCSPADQTLTPGDVAGAYGYDTLHRRGLLGQQMRINLVEIDGSYQDDIQNYLNCVQFKGHLSFVNIDSAPSDAEGESTLDVQMVAGLAPAASIDVYQTDGNANDDTWVHVNDELQKILDDNTSKANAGSVVSISLGIDEADITSDDVRALDSSLQQLTKVEHMTVFVASGDCAAFANEVFGNLSVSFPASDPWAVSVGGTELSVDDQHNRTDEVAWSDGLNPFKCNNSWGSGGGISSLFPRPGWQMGPGVQNKYSNGKRQVPDVSAVADNLAVYFQGQWTAVGGTSAAAPIWAAGQALVNEDTIQHLHTFGYSPQVYYAVADKHASANAYFNVTSGNNLYYPATPGWNYPTGFGTPNLVSFDQAVSSTLA